MFLENKYTDWYMSITGRAKTRLIEGYTEKHHILPKSLGGDDSVENIAVLTAREHFICHLLLTRMVVGRERHKMFKAARMMAITSSSGQHRYKITSKIYSILKTDPELPIETRQKMSVSQKNRFANTVGTFSGKTHSEETKQKIRMSRIGKKDSEITRLNKSKAGKNKPPITEETRQKLSIANRGKDLSGSKNPFYGKTHSDEQREKKRQEKLNSPRHECPHCSKITDTMNYARWHGDKCKNKQ